MRHLPNRTAWLPVLLVFCGGGCVKRVELTKKRGPLPTPATAARSEMSGVRSLPGWMRTASLHGDVSQPGSGVAGGKKTTRDKVPSSAVAAAELTLHLLVKRKQLLLGRTRSDASGRYAFSSIPPGAYLLSIRKSGFAGEKISLWVERGKNRAPALQLRPSAPVAGRVVDDRGRPVGSAVISITPTRGTPGLPVLTKTDAQGQFLADGLHPGLFRLSAHATGHRRAGINRLRAPARALRVRVVRLFSLRGTLRGELPDGGKVVVRLAGSGLWPGRSTTVAARDRSFVFKDIPSGVYEMVAWTSQPPWAASKLAEGLQVGPRQPPPVELKLAPAQRIFGQVKHQGKPIRGAVVVLGREHVSVLRNKTRTDGFGRFTLAPVVAGKYHLSVWARTFLPVLDRGLEIPARGAFQVELSRGASLGGVVKDPRGLALAGAAVWVVYRRKAATTGKRSTGGQLGVMPGPVPPIPPAEGWSPPSSVRSAASGTTDESGSFQVTGLWPGRARVVVDRRGYTQGRSPWITLVKGQRTRLKKELVLLPAAVLSGRVVDQWGRGVPSVRLTATDDHGKHKAGADSRGHFQFGGLHGRVVLVARCRGFMPVTVVRRLAVGARRSEEIVLEPARGQVSGHLLGPFRLPVSGATIVASRGALRVETRSERSGAFTLEGVGRGRLTISVHHERYLPLSQKLEPGRGKELRLSYWATLNGKVQDHRTGVPVRRYTLKLGTTGPGPTVHLKQRGHFVVTGLAPGKQQLHLQAPGYAGHSVTVAVARPSTAGARGAPPLIINLQRAGTISGRVTAPTGRGVKGAVVRAGKVHTRTTAGGRFKLVAVPGGSHVVEVQSKGRKQRFPPVLVRPDQDSGPLRLQLR